MAISDKELKSMFDDIGANWEKFKADHISKVDQLLDLGDRVDQVEASLDGLGPRATGKASGQQPLYREIFTGEGERAYELTSKQQFADVPDLAGKSEVSLERVLGAMALGSDCGDKEAVEFVNEIKATTTGTTGVTLENTVAAEWLDLVRAQSVLFQAGARSMSMPTQVMDFLHVTGDPTITWRTTEGGALSASDPTFAARTLTARTVAVRTQLSLEASQDIADAGRQIARVHTGAMAAAIDAAGFTGVAPEPTGLHTATGVGKVTGVGTPTNWDAVLDGVQTYLNANNAMDDLSAIAMHPNIWRIFAGLKTGITSDQTSLELPPSIAGVPQFVSTGADDVTSPEDYHLTLGNFSDLLVGFRMDPTVLILNDTTSMAANLLIEIVGIARVDIVALRPASFVVLEDLTTV